MPEQNDPQQTLSFAPDSNRLLSVFLTAAVANESDREVTVFDPLRDVIDGVRAAINAVSDNPAGRTSISLPGEDPLSLGSETRGVAYE